MVKSQEKSLPLIQTQDVIIREGFIERIVFHNPENGFTVMRLSNVKEIAEGGNRSLKGEQTAVGYIMAPKAGLNARFKGRYIQNKRFGKQFEFKFYEEIMPVTGEDIQNYLGSGIITGVGPKTAKKIVEAFGTDAIRILDEEPERLKEIKGITEKKFEAMLTSWKESRGMRDLMLFLQPHGISNAYAARIFKAYGGQATNVVSQNPYRLAMDIRGIGFLTADAIAAKLGFEGTHPLRVQASILYTLQKASDDGHVFLPLNVLLALVEKQIGAEPENIKSAIEILCKEDRIKTDSLDSDRSSDGNGTQIAVYLKRFYHCESKTAFYLERILRSPKSISFKNSSKAIDDVLKNLPIQLASAQKEAVRQSAVNKILVVTGGPGTGKTTIINAIIKVFESVKAKVLLAAPTGRAAKRMAETSGREARTVHRLLEYSPKDDKFLRNEDNPLVCHLLIIDEASMLDTLLFYYLLRAVPLGATVVLVGDICQLPSVGPGNVLGDIINSGRVNVCRLNEIFRQSAQSEIICNAHLINRGTMPLLEHSPNKISDFYYFPENDPERAGDLIVDLIKNRMPNRFKLDPVNDIQFLTPMHKGWVGAEIMNQKLQAALNPNGLEVRRGERSFRLHDKVMQIKNNYDKDIFNGDIGRISYIDAKERSLSVDFDGYIVPYAFEELEELIPAYAISIHKSQGSEYPAVVIPVMMQHYILLQRNLIYTAVTRGKRLVVLVGERRALEIAVSNNKTSARYTWLAQRLANSADF